MSEAVADTPLPRLRNDINLHRGPSESDGSPTWTLYDPPSNRFFRVGWLEFECLARFARSQTVSEVVRSVNTETPLQVSDEDVGDLVQFLISNELIVVVTSQATERFTKLEGLRQKAWWNKFLHGYLFFIIPLIRPDRFLQRTLPYIRPLLSQKFFVSMLCLLGYGFYLTLNRWDEFANTFMHFFTWEGLTFYIITISGVKILHEMGHAFVATKAGVRVSSMGVAFIVLYPVLFTETTGAWKLPDRHRRLLIGAGGVMAEICVAAIALLLWHILPDGSARSVAFFVATVSLAGSFLINLNPFMRFDGYYLLSDGLGMDNLQGRAFALAKWNMRRFLFGWSDPVPEDFKKPLRRLLYVYAYGTWLYRFFLFLGIAVLVYTLFFKPLGPFLMALELAWFIGLPIYREVIIWWKERRKMTWNSASKRTVGTLGFLLVLAFIPWHSTVRVPSYVQAKDYTRLHPPAPARIAEALVEQGQRVKSGDILLKLESPVLDHRIAQAKSSLETLKAQTLREATDRKLIHRGQVRNQQISEAQAAFDGLQQQKDRLIMRAPFDGVVAEKAFDLHKGRWVGEKQSLIHLVKFDRAVLRGYVRENDIRRIENGATGRFYPDTGISGAMTVQVKEISRTNASTIERPDLASTYGGSVAIAQSGGNSSALVPHDAVYAVLMEPVSPETAVPPHLLSGEVKLKGERKSFAARAFTRIAALVVRESGF
ncbi:MAG: hypothetical protein DHS20C02_18970 [Micavibrio sp.]|nr:MAG: hypothetical protein DHS20C02_18970 [Micavibrio sp.]